MRILFLTFLLSVLGTCLSFAQEPSEADAAEQKAKQADLDEAVKTTGSRLEFVGLKAFSGSEMRAKLAEQLQLIRKLGLTRPVADDTAFYVELFLRRMGYSEAYVQWEIVAGGTRLKLTVDEGPRTFLGKIEFAGDVQLQTSLLTDYLVGATRERFSTFVRKLPFVRTDLDDGTNRVRAYYQSEGYLHSQVSPPEITFSPDKSTADILLKVQAGPQFRIGEIRFEGNLILPEPDLRAKIETQADRPYTDLNVETMRRELQFYYTSKGYYFAKVKAINNPERAVKFKVPIVFQIEPGQLFTFDGITVSGWKRLKPKFLEKRFRSLAGKTYDPTALDKIYRKVMQTGLFDRLTITKTPIEGNQIRLDFATQEAKTKALGVYGGVATYDGLILGLTFEDRNAFGHGRPINAAAEVNLRGFNGEIQYKDPWLFDSDISMQLRIFVENTSYDGYTSASSGTRLELKRKFFEHLEITGFTQYQQVEITEADINTRFLGPTAYPLLTGGVALLYDRRDNPLSPTKGWYAGTSLSYNSDLLGVGYTRFTTGASYYKSFGKVLLAAGARYGTLITETFIGDLPITERFFNGGATTVRSFPEYELGPLDDGKYPIGGLTAAVFNVEANFPLVDALQGAVFVDAGSLAFETFDFDSSQLKYAVGLGLRYQLPIGPVRADYGFNPDRGPNDPFGAFHFSFGFAF